MKMFPPAAVLLFAVVVVAVTTTAGAFSPALMIRPRTTRGADSISSTRAAFIMALHMVEKEKQVESAFMPPPEDASEEQDEDDEIPLEKVETLGRGAAKVRYKIRH
jgi:hypothetical protein